MTFTTADVTPGFRFNSGVLIGEVVNVGAGIASIKWERIDGDLMATYSGPTGWPVSSVVKVANVQGVPGKKIKSLDEAEIKTSLLTGLPRPQAIRALKALDIEVEEEREVTITLTYTFKTDADVSGIDDADSLNHVFSIDSEADLDTPTGYVAPEVTVTEG